MTTTLYTCLTEAEAAWLNAPDRPFSFTDRCNAARATIYAEQRKRNERFEHLRRLLCKEPEAVAAAPAPVSPGEALRARVVAAAERRFAEGASARCTCKCRIPSHRPWFLRWIEPNGQKVWGAGDRDTPDCDDCYADRSPAQCKATLHWRTLPEPDSNTVRPPHPDPVENAAKHAELVHEGWECCEPIEAREPDPDITAEREHSKKVSKLTGIRDIDDERVYRAPKHALVAVNPKTRYVTVQYGAKTRCRITQNSSTLSLTLEWTDAEGIRHKQRTDSFEGKRYQSLDDLEAARDRAAQWLLEDGDKTPDERRDIQQARTTQYHSEAEMWAKVRQIRDLMAARGIETRVWNPTSTKKEAVAC